MRIIADPNIPYVAEAFAAFGEVRLKKGHELTRDDTAACDVLLVRSTVKVNEALLEGSPVRFVGTATSGYDHVDTDYLRGRKIAFAHALGSNAVSVGEYMTAALLHLAKMKSLDVSKMSMGIVGCGHAGREVLLRAKALGLHCVVNDPPLARASAEPLYRPLDEVLACDVVSLHVPLTREGPDATCAMADAAFFEGMKPGAIFINAARGGVVDEAALCDALDAGHLGGCVLDVWANEPEIDMATMERVDIATAHIAGHSFDGKAEGTRMLYEAYCAFCGATPSWTLEELLPPAGCPEIALDPRAPDAVSRAVCAVYDIMQDDAQLRALRSAAPADRGALFDGLRREYRQRRSFSRTLVRLTQPGAEPEKTLRQLGFSVAST